MSIDGFIANFKGGHRQNRFKVEIDGIDNKLKFMCRSTSIPESTINTIDVPFMGLTIPVPGDRAAGRIWTVEAFLDDNDSVRDSLENWSELIRPQLIPGGTDIATTLRTATVDLLGIDGETVVRSYKMLKCWPTNVGEIQLSMDSSDTISIYTVEFAFFGWLRA